MHIRLPLAVVLFFVTAMAAMAQDSAIEIRTETPGVTVYVDDVRAGTVEFSDLLDTHYLRIPVDPGTYSVRCEASGYETSVQRVEVVDNRARQINVVFRAVTDQSESLSTEQSVATARTGTLLVLSTPSGAAIEVNGTRQRNDTDARVTTATGEKTVRVFFPSSSVTTPPFQLDTDEEVTVRADFTTRPPTILVEKSVTINFLSDPPGAMLRIDGTELGAMPQSVDLSIRDRPYRASVSLDGYQSETIQITPTSNDLVRMELSPLRRTAHITSDPSGAEVFLVNGTNRVSIGTTPLDHVVPDAGSYTFFASKEEFIRYESGLETARFGINTTRQNVRLSLNPVDVATIQVIQDREYMPTSQLEVDNHSFGSISRLSTIAVPAGRRTLEIGSFRESYSFLAGRTYQLQAVFPLTRPSSLANPNLQLADASSLRGYREPPPEPEYLEETRPTYKTVTQFSGIGAISGAYYGLTVGFGLGAIVGLLADSQGALWGITIGGGVIGMLITGSYEGRVRDGSVPDTENIAKNRESRAAWRAAVSEINEHNQALVDQENERRRSAIERFEAQNRTRGYVLITDDRDNETRFEIDP